MHLSARTIARWLWRIHCGILLTVILLFGFGTPRADYLRCRAFVDACPRWQTNPKFRAVAREYVQTGSTAMQARLAVLPATDWIMAMRSVPYLPESLAANEGSRRHYEDFAAGEFSSYLRLSSEQGTGWVLESLQNLASESELSDEKLRQFLLQFKTEEKLAVDAGAIASLRKLIADTQASRGFAPPPQITRALEAAGLQLAGEVGYPSDTSQLTVDQQAAIYRGVDEYIRQENPELWRVKQVNDFLCGIWAQTYGQTYARWMAPVVRAWLPARVIGAAWLAGWVYLLVRRLRRSAGSRAASRILGGG